MLYEQCRPRPWITNWTTVSLTPPCCNMRCASIRASRSSGPPKKSTYMCLEQLTGGLAAGPPNPLSTKSPTEQGGSLNTFRLENHEILWRIRKDVQNITLCAAFSRPSCLQNVNFRIDDRRSEHSIRVEYLGLVYTAT